MYGLLFVGFLAVAAAPLRSIEPLCHPLSTPAVPESFELESGDLSLSVSVVIFTFYAARRIYPRLLQSCLMSHAGSTMHGALRLTANCAFIDVRVQTCRRGKQWEEVASYPSSDLGQSRLTPFYIHPTERRTKPVHTVSPPFPPQSRSRSGQLLLLR